MKVALVDCLGHGSKGRRHSTIDVISVGPRIIAGILESLGIKYEFFLLNEVFKDAEILRGYDVLLASGMAVDLGSMLRLIRLWRGGGIAIAGGPVCVEYEALLKNGYDFVVWGEAEDKLPILLKSIELGDDAVSDVSGIFKVVNGRVVGRLPSKYVDADLIWNYKPSLNVIKNYRGWWGARVYVEVVRGCSNFYRPTLKLASNISCNNCGICRSGDLELRIKCPLGIPPGCGYCSVPHLYGPARSKPIEYVVSEVKDLVKIGVRRIVLSAPDFLDFGRDWLVAPKPLTDPRSPPPNTKAIDELLSKLFDIPEIANQDSYLMIENIKPNLVNDDIARLLGKYLRGTAIGVGLETGDNVLHRSLGRPSSVGEVLKAVKLLCRYGIKPHIYLIHGLPHEDERSVINTVKTIHKLSKLDIEKFTLYRFTPLKGTAFEGFRKPPAAVSSPHTRMLYEIVRKYNTALKSKLIGSVIKAVVVGRRGPYLVAYPLPHGPVTYVRGSSSYLGKVISVRVVKVLSDREILGDIKNG
ncbi:MAG: radical SAM protein [Sulfolobales archaeon]